MPASRSSAASSPSGAIGLAAVITTRVFSGVMTVSSTEFHGISRGPSVQPGTSFSQASRTSSIWLSTHEKLTLTAGASAAGSPVTSSTSWNAQRRRWVTWPGIVKMSMNPRPSSQKSRDASRSAVGLRVNIGMP